MTNWEKYKDELLKLSLSGNIAKKNEKLVYCEEITCSECDFNKVSCTNDLRAWLDEEAVEEKKDCFKCKYAYEIAGHEDLRYCEYFEDTFMAHGSCNPFKK